MRPTYLDFNNSMQLLFELIFCNLILIKLHHEFILSFLLVQVSSDIELFNPHFSEFILQLSQFLCIWLILLVL